MAFLDDPGRLAEDSAIRRLAERRARSRELAEDALRDTFYAVSKTQNPEAIHDLRAFFCKSLIRAISRQLALSAVIPAEDIGAIADSNRGTSSSASVASEAFLRLLAEVALTRLERDRAELAMSLARSGDPLHLLARSRTWPDLAAEGQARFTGRDSRPDVAWLSVARTSALPTNGQMCAVFAVDIAGFTRPDRDDDIRLYLHEKLYEYLQKAFDSSGIPWQVCFTEDRGDGALIVVPPGISFKGLIHPLPETLRGLIRRHNHVSRESAAIQLRTAAHIGPVEYDGHGFVGTDVNFAFRMLEARPVKRMLAASGTELCLAISDYVYRTLVCRYPSLVHPDIFRTIRFQAKNIRARAWTYLPGALS